jgi:DNA primase
VFTFVKRYHKMEFREALEHLAERAGVTLTRRRSEQEAGGGITRATLISASATAQTFFQGVLRREDIGQAARELIHRRGMSAEVVETFGVGASPDRWDGLLLTIQKRGLDPAPFVAAGLLKKRESGSGMYDGFRNRLMFPIHDQIGRVIAFGARRINDEEEPKYLNSPESTLFDKSSTLYGLHVAARSIQREHFAIVTEGYMDAIACHQAGFSNAVATLGTALTRRHATVLKRLCDRVVLLFDSDEAGLRAADRAVEILLGEMLEVRVATLAPFTSAKDPDELLKAEGGRETFKRVIEGATDLLEFRFERLRERLRGAGVASVDRVLREELARLADLGLDRLDPLRRQLILKRLAEVTGLDVRTISQSVPTGRSARAGTLSSDRGGGTGRAGDPGNEHGGDGPGGERAPDDADREADPGQGYGDRDALEIGHAPLGPAETVVGCILVDASLWRLLEERDRDLMGACAYRWRVMESVVRAMQRAVGSGRDPGLKGVLSAAESDERVREAAIALHERVDRETRHDAGVLRSHFDACLRSARREHQRSSTAETTDPIARLAAERSLRASLGDDFRALPRTRT